MSGWLYSHQNGPRWNLISNLASCLGHASGKLGGLRSAELRKCGGQTWLAQANRQSHARCSEGGFLFIRITYLKLVFCILWSARLLCKGDRVLDPTEYSACVLWGKGGASISFTLFRRRGFIILLASSFRFSVTVLDFWGLLRLVNYHVSDSCYPRRPACNLASQPSPWIPILPYFFLWCLIFA